MSVFLTLIVSLRKELLNKVIGLFTLYTVRLVFMLLRDRNGSFEVSSLQSLFYCQVSNISVN